MIKQCRVCKTNLKFGTNASANDLKYSIYLCLDCKALKHKEYLEKNQYIKIKNLENKKIFIDTLGGECACCKESGWQFLTLDHINNDGAQDRKLGKHIGASSFYRFLDSENINRFQILCMNCNYCKGHNGFCPHIFNETDHDICLMCEIPLNEKNWFHVNKTYNHNLCNDCLIQNSVCKNTNTNKSIKLNKKKDVLNLKFKVINEYGGKCECCGEQDILFLNIDHINGFGRQEN